MWLFQFNILSTSKPRNLVTSSSVICFFMNSNHWRELQYHVDILRATGGEHIEMHSVRTWKDVEYLTKNHIALCHEVFSNDGLYWCQDFVDSLCIYSFRHIGLFNFFSISDLYCSLNIVMLLNLDD